MSYSCTRCGEPTVIFSVDLPIPAPLCADCCDVAMSIPPSDELGWSAFVAECSRLRCDCGKTVLPNTTDVCVLMDDIAHAEPLCLPMPVGAR